MAQRARPRVTQTTPGTLEEGVRVRHYDELDDSEKQAMFSAVHEDGPDDRGALPADSVVVFNGYHEVR